LKLRHDNYKAFRNLYQKSAKDLSDLGQGNRTHNILIYASGYHAEARDLATEIRRRSSEEKARKLLGANYLNPFN
jgi:hypothetical protein